MLAAARVERAALGLPLPPPTLPPPHTPLPGARGGRVSGGYGGPPEQRAAGYVVRLDEAQVRALDALLAGVAGGGGGPTWPPSRSLPHALASAPPEEEGRRLPPPPQRPCSAPLPGGGLCGSEVALGGGSGSFSGELGGGAVAARARGGPSTTEGAGGRDEWAATPDVHDGDGNADDGASSSWPGVGRLGPAECSGASSLPAPSPTGRSLQSSPPAGEDVAATGGGSDGRSAVLSHHHQHSIPHDWRAPIPEADALQGPRDLLGLSVAARQPVSRAPRDDTVGLSHSLRAPDTGEASPAAAGRAGSAPVQHRPLTASPLRGMTRTAAASAARALVAAWAASVQPQPLSDSEGRGEGCLRATAPAWLQPRSRAGSASGGGSFRTSGAVDVSGGGHAVGQRPSTAPLASSLARAPAALACTPGDRRSHRCQDGSTASRHVGTTSSSSVTLVAQTLSTGTRSVRRRSLSLLLLDDEGGADASAAAAAGFEAVPPLSSAAGGDGASHACSTELAPGLARIAAAAAPPPASEQLQPLMSPGAASEPRSPVPSDGTSALGATGAPTQPVRSAASSCTASCAGASVAAADVCADGARARVPLQAGAGGGARGRRAAGPAPGAGGSRGVAAAPVAAAVVTLAFTGASAAAGRG